ncbi:hypothetical protein DK842_08405 [Chromobacterium phragmitis]|uniref:hypothetical protein n=1 Tax=Chromobacterium phragmitis TaxID=2202141 RepID=UPI000DED20A4|nr:hypothetical protein [Chromobacterium phragmitis]AXE29908.1 hypothetical protein DK842_08405 [Chromobacterium phragmitis]
MRQNTSALLLAALLPVLLAGCGKKQMPTDAAMPSGVEASSPSGQSRIGGHGEDGSELQRLVARNLRHQLALAVPAGQVEARWLAVRTECLRLGCLLEEAAYSRYDDEGYNGEARVNARLPHGQVEPYLAFLRKQGVLMRQSSELNARRQEIAQLEQDVRDGAKTARDASAGKSAVLRQGLAEVARLQAEQAAISAAVLNTQPVSVELAPERPGIWQRSAQMLWQSAQALLTLCGLVLPFAAAGAALWWLARRFGKSRRAADDKRKIEDGNRDTSGN